MAYKIVSNKEIEKKYNSLLKMNPIVVDEGQLDSNYQKLRKYCIEQYKEIENKVKKNKELKSWKHQLDLEFGLALYDYLNSDDDFNARYEADYSFWKYFAVFVVPDIVANRWGVDKKDHFYKKPTDIYPFQVY